MADFTVVVSNWVAGSDGKVRGTDPDGTFSEDSDFTGAPAYAIGSGTEYHVAKTGNDTTGDGSSGSPWLTIEKALTDGATTAGDTISVHAGTYVETGSHTVQDSYKASMLCRASGSSGEPITLRANPGDEGSVIIDGQSTIAGIRVAHEDYWQFYGLRFVNHLLGAIVISDAFDDVITTAGLAKNIRVENCYIGNTVSDNPGYNVASLRFFHIQNVTIKNVKIRNTDPDVHAFQNYGASDYIIENCDFETTKIAVFNKAHLIATVSGGAVIGGEVKYSKLKGQLAWMEQPQGAGGNEAGFDWIHHNILQSTSTNNEEAVIRSLMPGAARQSTRKRIEHNTCWGNGFGAMVYMASFNDVEIYGNIAANVRSVHYLGGQQNGFDTFLTECDYTVADWTNANYAEMDRLDTLAEGYTLAEFQAGTIASEAPTSFAVDTPDANGVSAAAADLFDTPGTTFTNKTGSPAIGIMPGGNNAGCYETGSEVVGLTASYTAGA